MTEPVEEACKLGVVLLFIWKNPNFNEENDGIVYMGASAVGFALLENIFYVAQNGIGTGILRAFTAIPLHVLTAVVLGLHVGRAKFAASEARRNLLVWRGFLFAWAFHGLYDMLAMSESALALLLLPLLGGLAAFGVMALRRGRRLSLARWDSATPSDIVAAPPLASAAVPGHAVGRIPKAHRWMPVVSRPLLACCAAFWLLLIFGLMGSTTAEDVGYGALGGILLTIIPAAIGVALEVVYHRHRKAARSVRAGLSVN